MTRDDDLRALADVPVHQPPFGEVTRRSARLQRRRRTAAAFVSVLAVVGAGIGISVSRDGDGDNVATVDPTAQPSIATTPQATVDHSPPDPAPTTPPEPTVVEPTPTSATGSTRCSGKAVDGKVIGAADVDGDGALDDIVAGQGPDGDPIMVAHNPATFGWTGGADLQGWIGAAVLGASALDESPGDEVLVDVGGNTAWNAAIVSMSDCQLSAVTTGEPPEVLLLLHGATGLSCMPTGCAARIRCADGHVIAEQASPAEAEEELDWYRTTYRIEGSRAIEVSTEAGTSTLSDLPFPRDQTVHCPTPQPTLPSGFLGVTTQGEIVEVNTSDGVVGRSWGSLADPTVPLPPNAAIAPNYVDGAWRLGHSPFMYVSQCCEPAGGNILRVFDDLANAESISGGWVGVPSPDGLATAFVDLTGASVVITGVSGRRIEIGPARDSSVDTVPGGLSWLRDRPGVVWSTYSGDVRVIELDVNYEPVRDRALPELGPLHGATVAARGDGVLVVAGCVEPDVGQQCPESRALIVDPDTGETLDELSVEPGARLGGYDRTGTFLIYVDGAGTVRWTAGTDNGVIAEGYRWATW